MSKKKDEARAAETRKERRDRAMVLVPLRDVQDGPRAKIERVFDVKEKKARALRVIREGVKAGQEAPSAEQGLRGGAYKVTKPPRSTADGTKSGPLAFDTAPNATPIVPGEATPVSDGTDDAGRADVGKVYPAKGVERDPSKGRWVP